MERGTGAIEADVLPTSLRDGRRERIALLLSYDGSEFAGFQSQTNGRAVQDVLERALRSLYSREVRLVGASRTDRGVHATGQVAVYTIRPEDPRIPVDRLAQAMTALLPHDVAVLGAQRVLDAAFDPTHAHSKTYRYRILNREAPCPIRRRVVWQVREPLDVDLANRELGAILGSHDFRVFCGAGSKVQSTVREILGVSVRGACDEVRVEITGTGFLYHMVRSLVGTVVEVALRRRPVGDVARILESGVRSEVGPTAPAQGLCLTDIRYEPDLSGGWLGPVSVDRVRYPTVH